MSEIVEQISVVPAVLLVAAATVAAPLVVLDALNMLGFTIAITMKTWFAALLLVIVVRARI